MKQTNFKVFTLLFIAALFLTSCSSSDDSGESNGTTTGDYLPLAVGNVWNYTDGSNATQSKITGTTTFGNTVYYESEDTNAQFDIQNWLVKKGAAYYQRTGEYATNQSGTTIVIEGYELKVLRDDIATGESWQGSASPKVTYSGSSGSGSFKAKVSYTGTVTAKGVSETLGGIIYNNIIKVQLHSTTNANGQISTADAEYWFAKDIGSVKEVETSSTDGITRTRYLTSYSLN